MPNSSTAACLVSLAVTATTFAQSLLQCGQWLPLAGPDGQGLDDNVRALAVFDAGDGPMLYAGGDFQNAGGQRAPHLARWDGQRWSAVPGLVGPDNEIDAFVLELTVWDDGTGPALYVGGGFTTAAGLEANHIARFDGDSWRALAGPDAVGVDGPVSAIHAHDTGDGEALYVGGRFASAGGLPTNMVARWDGRTWSALQGDQTLARRPVDLQTYQGDLYASGWYAPSIAHGGVQRWDGSAWTHAIGPSQTFRAQEVWPLATWDDGTGERLYAGGRFSVGEGDTDIASGFAWWDGERWSGLGRLPVALQFGDLLPFDDGAGEALYLAGSINVPLSGRKVAVGRFIDGRMQALQGAPEIFGRALCVYDAGHGPALYVGGDFRTTPDFQPGYIARWQPGPQCPADFTNDCQVDVRDYWEFRLLFVSGDPRADLDADGSLTIFDMLAYQNAFDAGCP